MLVFKHKSFKKSICLGYEIPRLLLYRRGVSLGGETRTNREV